MPRRNRLLISILVSLLLNGLCIVWLGATDRLHPSAAAVLPPPVASLRPLPIQPEPPAPPAAKLGSPPAPEPGSPPAPNSGGAIKKDAGKKSAGKSSERKKGGATPPLHRMVKSRVGARSPRPNTSQAKAQAKPKAQAKQSGSPSVPESLHPTNSGSVGAKSHLVPPELGARGRKLNSSAKSAAKSGTHSQSAGHAQTAGQHSTQAGQHSTQAGQHSTQAGQHSAQAGQHSSATSQTGKLAGLPKTGGKTDGSAGKAASIPSAVAQIVPMGNPSEEQRPVIDPGDETNHWNGHAPQLPPETPPMPGMTPGGLLPKTVTVVTPKTPAWFGSPSLRGDLPVHVPQMKPVPVAVKPPQFIGDGTGLLGSYYFGLNFDRLAFRRADRNIDYVWSNSSPDLVRLPIGNAYTVLWQGSLIPRYSETYTLYTDSDDGVRVWIDGRLVIDDWSIHGEAEDAAVLPLAAGQPYDLRVEYFEKNGLSGEVIKLYWQSPSQPREFVPESQLRYPKSE